MNWKFWFSLLFLVSMTFDICTGTNFETLSFFIILTRLNMTQNSTKRPYHKMIGRTDSNILLC